VPEGVFYEDDEALCVSAVDVTPSTIGALMGLGRVYCRTSTQTAVPRNPEAVPTDARKPSR
jgi:hypothetical protein